MAPYTELGLQFLGTLIATGIGVYAAFRLDRKLEQRRLHQTVRADLDSISQELERIQQITDANRHLLSQFQNRKNDVPYYVLRQYPTDAWRASLQDELVEVLGADLFEDLLQVYSDADHLNQLIERTHIEWLHPDIGQDESGILDKLGGHAGNIFDRDTIWSIGVNYYNEDKEEMDLLALGPLIKRLSADLGRDAKGLSEDVKEYLATA